MQQSIYSHSRNISEVTVTLLFHSHKNMHIMSSASPEQARHGVPCNIVQRSVVLVGFTIG